MAFVTQALTCASDERICGKDIGIITQYKAQKDLIVELLNRTNAEAMEKMKPGQFAKHQLMGHTYIAVSYEGTIVKGQVVHIGNVEYTVVNADVLEVRKSAAAEAEPGEEDAAAAKTIVRVIQIEPGLMSDKFQGENMYFELGFASI